MRGVRATGFPMDSGDNWITIDSATSTVPVRIVGGTVTAFQVPAGTYRIFGTFAAVQTDPSIGIMICVRATRDTVPVMAIANYFPAPAAGSDDHSRRFPGSAVPWAMHALSFVRIVVREGESIYCNCSVGETVYLFLKRVD